MSIRQIQAGSTDQSIVIRIIDSSDGTPETGVTSATSGIDLWYRREGAASVDITESDLSALTDAHSDGGMLHINDGWYRVDFPDAAFADGVVGVQIGGTVTGMVVLAPYVELVDYNPYDGVRLGLTALPNAAADAAGGLPVSDAGGLDLDTLDSNVLDVLTDTGTTIPAQITALNDPTAAAIRAEIDSNSTQLAAIVADTNELQGDWTDGGRLDLILDARASQTSVDTVDGNVDAILVDTGTTIPAQITALNDPTAAAIADAVWDEAKSGHVISGSFGEEVQAHALSSEVSALNDIDAATVNAQVLDVLNVDTFSELTGVPADDATLTQMIRWLYIQARNKITQTSTTQTIYADDGSTSVATSTVSDDGTTATRGEFS